MKYAFIESDLVGEFPLPVICRVLRVTQAGYHAWLKRPASAMSVARDALAALIGRVFTAFKGKYGAPRIYRELARQHGYTGSFERVRVLMQRMGLKAKAGSKYKLTTDSAHALPIAPNLLEQDFTHTHASAPNQVWLSDITPAFAGAGCICGRKKAGCLWPACSTCSPERSWAGRLIRTCEKAWYTTRSRWPNSETVSRQRAAWEGSSFIQTKAANTQPTRPANTCKRWATGNR